MAGVMLMALGLALAARSSRFRCAFFPPLRRGGKGSFAPAVALSRATKTLVAKQPLQHGQPQLFITPPARGGLRFPSVESFDQALGPRQPRVEPRAAKSPQVAGKHPPGVRGVNVVPGGKNGQ
jgi:hypothetical protein